MTQWRILCLFLLIVVSTFAQIKEDKTIDDLNAKALKIYPSNSREATR
ncbi:MAG: hypothetical protein KDC50_05565 [Flavobacterium sp.]|nr:hypothetical protein [Flavobacterium sp.]